MSGISAVGPEAENGDRGLLFRGSDVEELSDLIRVRFAPHRLSVLGDHPLDGCFRRVHEGAVAIYELGYGSEVDITPEAPLDFYNIHVPLMRRRRRHREREAALLPAEHRGTGTEADDALEPRQREPVPDRPAPRRRPGPRRPARRPAAEAPGLRSGLRRPGGPGAGVAERGEALRRIRRLRPRGPFATGDPALRAAPRERPAGRTAPPAQRGGGGPRPRRPAQRRTARHGLLCRTSPANPYRWPTWRRPPGSASGV